MMKLHDNVEINFEYENRGSQMLQIACNMNKCKYSIMTESTLHTHIPTTMIFISIQTILGDWFKLCGNTCIPKDVSGEEIASNLLSIVSHYRRFYYEFGKCNQTYVFLYYSNDWTTNFKSIFLNAPEMIRECANNVKDALNLISTIVTYIPGLYYINTGSLHPGVLPYYIVSKSSQKIQSINNPNKQRILIISKDFLDYHSLGVSSRNDDFDIYIFRRKYAILYHRNNIIKGLIMREKRSDASKVNFSLHYTYILTAYANILTHFKGSNLKHLLEFRKMLVQHLNSLVKQNIHSFIELNDLRSYVDERPNIKEIYDIVNIPSIHNKNILELTNLESIWRQDRIDYSIEALNDSYFRTFRVDFASLF